MQNQNQTTPNNQKPLPPRPAPTTVKPATATQQSISDTIAQDTFVRKIVEKIKSSENILVALSNDPTVDEMAAAIGLTLFLDGLQKHATAIYSGKTPDALQFLQPEGTFESNTDSLRDFIIALNKEKADHLRYKLEGDFVKVYITPYKTVIGESDLEFSQGDFNVSLVLALGVPTPEDLDEALSEYGRIMHDATTVDITIDAAGRFAEIEWCDPKASSVSEMVLRIIEDINGKDARIDKDIATALLTGIVAATDRFSNGRTNSDTMQIAAKLMSMGADQQLIAAHVMDGNKAVVSSNDETAEEPADEGNLLVGKDYEQKPVEAEVASEAVVESDNIADSGAVPDLLAQPTRESRAAATEAANAALQNAVSEATSNAAAAGASGVGMVEAGRNLSERVLEPTTDTIDPAQVSVLGSQMGQNQVEQPQPVYSNSGGPSFVPPSASSSLGPKNYAEMLEKELAGADNNAIMNVPGVTQGVEISNPVVDTPAANPDAQMTELGVAEPVINPDGIVLPPPPDPDMGNSVMPPVMPNVVPDPNMEANLAAAAQIQEGIVEQPQAEPAKPMSPVEPGAFQIPGMQ